MCFFWISENVTGERRGCQNNIAEATFLIVVGRFGNDSLGEKICEADYYDRARNITHILSERVEAEMSMRLSGYHPTISH